MGHVSGSSSRLQRVTPADKVHVAVAIPVWVKQKIK
jgi:hypothetical protein